MQKLDRITFNPQVMGGKPCIRGMRVTVGTLVGLVASGNSVEDILKAYPYVEEEDIRQALTYAAWRVEEIDLPLDIYENSVIQVRRPNTLPHNFQDWFIDILHQHEAALERGCCLPWMEIEREYIFYPSQQEVYSLLTSGCVYPA